MRNKEYENDIYELHNEIAKLNALLNEYLPEMENYRQRRKMEQAIIKAKIELKAQENNPPKMPLASTARISAKRVEKKCSQEAKQLAQDELYHLNLCTQRAIAKGYFSTNYTWWYNLWEEWKISAEDFMKAIMSLLENYGYTIDYSGFIKQKTKIMGIEIKWSWRERNE